MKTVTGVSITPLQFHLRVFIGENLNKHGTNMFCVMVAFPNNQDRVKCVYFEIDFN